VEGLKAPPIEQASHLESNPTGFVYCEVIHGAFYFELEPIPCIQEGGTDQRLMDVSGWSGQKQVDVLGRPGTVSEPELQSIAPLDYPGAGLILCEAKQEPLKHH